MNGRARAQENNWPEYPEYREKFGEDPARFLYAEMDARPRIRGLESLELCRAWLDVETDVTPPRRRVVKAINERMDELRENQAGAESNNEEAPA